MADSDGDGCGLDTDVGAGDSYGRGGDGVKSKTCSSSCGNDGEIDGGIPTKTGLRLSEGSAVRTLQKTDRLSRSSSTGNR